MRLADLLLRPGLVPILLAAPAAGLLLFAIDRARARRLARVAGPRAPALASELGRRRRSTRRILFSAALLLALVATLQPVWGEGPALADPGALDLVVCLDVSRSMLARDVSPSRLERAKREIRALAERAAGDRMALVAFAGEARIVVPLTRDLSSLLTLADRADPLTVPRGGTDLGAALAVAVRALDGGAGGTGAILLLTDGDDLEGRGRNVAETCRERDIVVHVVGFGSERGAKIPVESAGGEAFLRDRSGREVISARNDAGLRAIAARTGGGYAGTGEGGNTLVALYEDSIRPAALGARTDDRRRERQNRFQWPLFAAFLLWTFDLGLSERRR